MDGWDMVAADIQQFERSVTADQIGRLVANRGTDERKGCRVIDEQRASRQCNHIEGPIVVGLPQAGATALPERWLALVQVSVHRVMIACRFTAIETSDGKHSSG